MTEARYQSKLIKKLEDIFPGCVILKNDSSYRQGIPDIILLWNEFWASLEVKVDEDASSRPNQDHYIQKLNEMSFAAYIFPENEEEVLDALQQAFKSPRRARVS